MGLAAGAFVNDPFLGMDMDWRGMRSRRHKTTDAQRIKRIATSRRRNKNARLARRLNRVR
jgi:hypothetical protein